MLFNKQMHRYAVLFLYIGNNHVALVFYFIIFSKINHEWMDCGIGAVPMKFLDLVLREKYKFLRKIELHSKLPF
jgi:hypothetical protein